MNRSFSFAFKGGKSKSKKLKKEIEKLEDEVEELKTNIIKLETDNSRMKKKERRLVTHSPHISRKRMNKSYSRKSTSWKSSC